MSESFGVRLRQRREQRQVALSTIAEATKIKVTLLDALERDDVSHWPSGIFGRSFLRSYAQMIGLDPATVVREFLTLHPEPQFLEGHRNGGDGFAIVAPPAPVPSNVPVDAATDDSELSSARLIPRAPVRSSPPMRPTRPVLPSAAEPPGPDLTAAAQLCIALGCLQGILAAAPLVEKAARVVDATGIIVWRWDQPSEQLRAVLTHGYSKHGIAQLPGVGRDSHNATAPAFRSVETSVVHARGGAGALAIPLMAPDACVGVLALELSSGGEEREAVRAVATIIGAQFARLIALERMMPVAERLLA